MREALRRTLPLAFGILVQMIGHGMISTYFGVMAQESGFSQERVGLLGGVYMVGAIMAAIISSKIIVRIGHVRLFALSTGILTTSVILLSVWVDFYFWGLLRFFYGFAITATFVVGDSWFSHAAKNEFRGKIMAIYMTTTYVGVALGQLLLYYMGDFSSWTVLVFIGVAFSLASTSILLTIQPSPPLINPVPMSPLVLLNRVPVSVITSILLGMLFANVSTMMPVMLNAQGTSLASIAFVMLWFQVGGFLGQYPLGFISDKTDRRRVILVALVSVFILFSIILYLLLGDKLGLSGYLFLSVSMFLLGFFLLPSYAVNMSHANDRLDENEIVGAVATLVFVHSVGGVLGPSVSGVVMGMGGGVGFLLLLMIPTVLTVGFIIFRILLMGPVEDSSDRVLHSVLPRNVTPVTQILTQDDEEIGESEDLAETDNLEVEKQEGQ